MNWLEKDRLEGIEKGDRKAFDRIFKTYYHGLCIFAYDFLKSHDTAEEIVQEVFLHLWENHENVQIKISLKSYLYKSVQNRCLNYIRDNGQLQRNQIRIDQLEIELLSIEIPEEMLDVSFSEQWENELKTAIENLPEQCREIFSLSRYENLSYPEIAKRLNVSLSTVKTQMSRAMNKLWEIMSKFI